jgi:hypothetical protein
MFKGRPPEPGLKPLGGKSRKRSKREFPVFHHLDRDCGLRETNAGMAQQTADERRMKQGHGQRDREAPARAPADPRGRAGGAAGFWVKAWSIIAALDHDARLHDELFRAIWEELMSGRLARGVLVAKEE